MYFFPLLNKQVVLRGELGLELDRWQGPPYIDKVKQYEIVSFKGCLFLQIFLFWLESIPQNNKLHLQGYKSYTMLL